MYTGIRTTCTENTDVFIGNGGNSILGTALTPFVAVWLNQLGGVGAVGVYLTVTSALSVVFILLTHETRDVDMNAVGSKK